MLLDQLKLRGGQLAGLFQNAFRNENFADIMQSGCRADQFDIIWLQCVAVGPFAQLQQ